MDEANKIEQWKKIKKSEPIIDFWKNFEICFLDDKRYLFAIDAAGECKFLFCYHNKNKLDEILTYIKSIEEFAKEQHWAKINIYLIVNFRLYTLPLADIEKLPKNIKYFRFTGNVLKFDRIDLEYTISNYKKYHEDIDDNTYSNSEKRDYEADSLMYAFENDPENLWNVD